MLKNYKPYGELDLTEDGYLFELTNVELTFIIGNLTTSNIYDLASATDLSNTEIKSTLNLTDLYEKIKSDKFNRITCKAKMGDSISTFTLNKIGNAFVIVAPYTNGTILAFALEINTSIEIVRLNFGMANLYIE